MDKQSTLAFILIGVILVFWLYFNSPTPPPQNPNKQDTTKVQNDSLPKPPVEEKKVVEQKPEEDQIAPFGISNQPEKIITIETDLAKIELTNKGAKLRRYFLKKYKTWYHADVKDTNFYNQQVQLVNTNKNGGDLNILFVTKEGKLVNTSSLDFTTPANNYYYKISGKDSLLISYTFSTGENNSIVKDFVFYGKDYSSKIEIELNNM
jgi:YidC/Oxa1 family membrane protein insertase